MLLGPIGYHDLRSTFAVVLISAGVDTQLVSRWLGHSSPQITRRVYSPVLQPSNMNSTADAVQEQLNQAAEEPSKALSIFLKVREDLGIPINHVVDIDFFGFKEVVDAVGGVTICFEYDTRDLNSGLVQQAGCNELDGVEALAYARSRNYEEFRDGQWVKDPTADLGRIVRQQAFISTIVNSTLTELKSDPFLAASLIEAVGGSLRIDRGLDPIGAAGTLRQAFSTGLATYQLDVRGEDFNGKAVLRVNDSSKPVLDYFRGVGPLPAAAVPE